MSFISALASLSSMASGDTHVCVIGTNTPARARCSAPRITAVRYVPRLRSLAALAGNTLGRVGRVTEGVFTIVGRRATGDLAKHTGEIAGVREPAPLGNLRDVIERVQQ